MPSDMFDTPQQTPVQVRLPKNSDCVEAKISYSEAEIKVILMDKLKREITDLVDVSIMFIPTEYRFLATVKLKTRRAE